MDEHGTQVEVGNRIIEGRFQDILFNYRHDHSQLPKDIIDEMGRYVNRHPDFRTVILNNIRSANWTIEELDALID